MKSNSRNRFFLPAGRSSRILFGCVLFWRGPREERGKKKKVAAGRKREGKKGLITSTHIKFYSAAYHPHHCYPSRRHPPTSVFIRRRCFRRPPPSAIVYCHPLLFSAIRRRPPSAAVHRHHQLIATPLPQRIHDPLHRCC